MPDDPADTPEPPPRKFGFKDNEFERANQPVKKGDAEAIDVHTLNRQAQATPLTFGAKREAPTENEVHEILRANLARANEDGLNDLELIVPRPSRRKRDYWFLMIGGNGAILGLTFALTHAIGPLAVALSFCLLYTIGISWVMWFIMSDY